MTTSVESKSAIRNFIEMLCAELTSYPGRAPLVGRMTLACTSVMVLAEVFRIPGAVLGASFPILVSRESPEAARKSAFQIALACSIGAAEIILGGVFTAGSPFLHLMWVLTSLLAALYAMSSFNFSSPTLTASAVIAIGIQEWDYPISAELRVEHTLYTLLSIVIGCIASALIETLFAKKNSPNAILDGIDRRLGLVETLLSQAQEKDFPPSELAIQLSRTASKGVSELSQLLARSHYEPSFHNLLVTVIALTRQLVELGSLLTESSEALTLADQTACLTIAQNLSSIRSSLCKDTPSRIDLPLASEIANPILVEIELTVDLITQSFSADKLVSHPLQSKPAPEPPSSAFVLSAFGGNEHFKFAVRGTLSAFLCYLFHLSIGWAGLAASILTCALTARRFIGASRQRQVLRFAGFLIGAGVIGWGTEVFLLPHIDTLAQYTLLFASVAWIGSWIATSGPRISFSGFQIVIAYNLVNLNRFTINTSLVPARDAVLSIMLGVVAMWLVFDHLWIENAGSSVRNLLLATLQSLADFKTFASETRHETIQILDAISSKISQDLDKLRDLADMYTFEPFSTTSHESVVRRSVQTFTPQLRAILFAKTGLLQHRTLIAGIPDALSREAEEYASSVLLAVADTIETGSVERLSTWNADAEIVRAKVRDEEIASAAQKNRQKYIEMRLSASLLDLTYHLEREWIHSIATAERSQDVRSTQVAL